MVLKQKSFCLFVGKFLQEAELVLKLAYERLVKLVGFNFVSSCFFDDKTVVFVCDQLVTVTNPEYFQFFIGLECSKKVFAHFLDFPNVG